MTHAAKAEQQLRDDYIDWMYTLVCDKDYVRNLSYKKLFEHLYSTDFTAKLPMDANREEDGIELRYRFGRMNKIPEPMIASYLDQTHCSILEMMVALALRMEDQIMDNPEYGNRSGQWFWEMIVSMGLGSFSDDNFHIDSFNEIVAHFLDRSYARNGQGGLFVVQDPNVDMRNIEIWYQMHRYLGEILDD